MQEVCSFLALERHTVAKYLDVLRSQGLINFKQAGMSKLWFATKHPFIEVLKNEDISDGIKSIADSVGRVAIVNKDYKVEWSNSGIKEAQCFEALAHSKERCQNCPASRTFKTGKVHEANIGETLVITRPLKDNKGNVVGIVEIRK